MTHTFSPHPKYPWFCKDCGYAEHERLQHSVSDGSPQGQDAKQPDPKDDSAVPVRQTPFPTSPLNEGAFRLAADALYAANSRVHWSDAEIEDAAEPIAKALTTLLTNLAKVQRERDEWQSRAAERDAEANKYLTRAVEAESRLSHLQTRLEEVEGALRRLIQAVDDREAALLGNDTPKFLTAVTRLGKAMETARAALQPKGESNA